MAPRDCRWAGEAIGGEAIRFAQGNCRLPRRYDDDWLVSGMGIPETIWVMVSGIPIPETWRRWAGEAIGGEAVCFTHHDCRLPRRYDIDCK